MATLNSAIFLSTDIHSSMTHKHKRNAMPRRTMCSYKHIAETKTWFWLGSPITNTSIYRAVSCESHCEYNTINWVHFKNHRMWILRSCHWIRTIFLFFFFVEIIFSFWCWKEFEELFVYCCTGCVWMAWLTNELRLSFTENAWGRKS